MRTGGSNESTLLDSLFAAARQEQPAELALERTLVAAGLLSVAAGSTVSTVSSHAAAEALAEVTASCVDSPVTVIGAAGKITAASGVAGTSTVGALGAAGGAALAKGSTSSLLLVCGKWLALGFASGTMAVGVGAVTTGRLDSVDIEERSVETRVAAPLPVRAPEGRESTLPREHPAPPAPRAASHSVEVASRSQAASGQHVVLPLPPPRASSERSDVVEEQRTTALLAIEVAAIEKARLALRTGDAARAAAAARQYRHDYPTGVFLAEAHYIGMEAELQTGNVAAAKREAEAIVSGFPASAQEGKARRLLSSGAE